MNIWMNGRTDGRTEVHTDRQTGRQTDRQTDRQIRQLLIKLQLRRHNLSRIGMELHIGAKISLCVSIGMPHPHLNPLRHVTQTSLIDLLPKSPNSAP